MTMNTHFKAFLVPAAVGATLVASGPAFAHHPLGGAPMETFTHGLLSGIGHPLLGFDHLFFVLLMGVAAVFTGHRFLAPAAYVGAMLVGCLAMSLGFGLPAKEVVIALSLVALGGLVLSGRTVSPMLLVAAFAGFGLFHGSAFGDTIADQEAAMGAEVLVGYLIGLGVLQYGIALLAGWAMTALFKVTSSAAVEARLSGAVVAGVGAFLTLEHLEGALLSALL